MKKHRISRYLKTRTKGKWSVIFHELHPDPMYCLSKDWSEFLMDIKDDDYSNNHILKQLKERGLVISSKKEDEAELKKAVDYLVNKLNQTSILYLVMATGCNYDCKYCPLPERARSTKGNSLLSIDDAKAGIDIWSSHIWDNFNKDIEYYIIFYGGEPLLNKQTLREILPYIKKSVESGKLPSDNLKLMISTNGSLVDEEIIQLCKEYDISVAVGIDGPLKVNDKLRVDNNNKGTYTATIHAIRDLVNNSIKTYASVSITPYNVSEIKHYSKMFKEMGVDQFGFNFLKGKQFSQLFPKLNINDYYESAIKGVLDNYYQQKSKGYEFQMAKKHTAYFQKDWFPVDCTCYGNQIVILPGGNISNCPFSQQHIAKIGNIDNDFRIWNTKIVREWRKRMPLLSDSGEHTNFVATSLHGGGCAWSSYETKGSYTAVDDCAEMFSETVLDVFLWQGFNE